MRQEVLSVKVQPEVMADLEAFAMQEFPMTCPKCRGGGKIRTGTCPKCDGEGVIGNKSEATRFLLHFALGQKASPEARAMIAVYSNLAPRIISAVLSGTHQMIDDLRDLIVDTIQQAESH